MCVGILLGIFISGRYAFVVPAAFSPAEVAAAAYESNADRAVQLAQKIQEADRAIEHFVLLPTANNRSEGDRRVAQFLWNAALQPSKELLGNPRLVHALKDREPQTLLLARLHETAGFAEDGQLGAAATAWKSADELARQLQKRNLLDERLRWRSFIAVRLLDRCMTRRNRSTESLKLLEDAWQIFGPGDPGQPDATPTFKLVCDDFQKYMQQRQQPSAQVSPPPWQSLKQPLPFQLRKHSPESPPLPPPAAVHCIHQETNT